MEATTDNSQCFVVVMITDPLRKMSMKLFKHLDCFLDKYLDDLFICIVCQDVELFLFG